MLESNNHVHKNETFSLFSKLYVVFNYLLIQCQYKKNKYARFLIQK